MVSVQTRRAIVPTAGRAVLPVKVMRQVMRFVRMDYANALQINQHSVLIGLEKVIV